MGFISQYFNLAEQTGEHQVLCPFPHYTANGAPYNETDPSASVNTDEELFHCMACGRGHNEPTFMQEILGVKRVYAYKLLPAFNNDETLQAWLDDDTLCHTYPIPAASSFNIDEEIQKELHLSTRDGADIDFPVFMYDKLVDVRNYKPGRNPKCKSRLHATSGIVIPFDLWRNTPKDRWTIICAGEKDMAVARSHGFNAISITGGEGRLPNCPKLFEGRLVAICYDNDNMGHMGANKLAKHLYQHGAIVKVVTKFHEGMEDKEDITDYFNKYSHTKEDLIECLEATELFVDFEYEESLKLIDLHEATQPSNTGKICRSNIQVSAVSDATFTAPTEVVAKKMSISDDTKANQMAVGSIKVWALEEDNIEDILHLMDNNFKEKNLRDNKKMLTKVPFKERCVSYKDYGRKTIYKAVVTDMFETTTDTNNMPMEYHAYSIGHRLESGKKYTATYKIVPHPYSGQQLIMIIWDIKQASDSVNSFTINEETKSHLNVVREMSEELGVTDTVEHCAEMFKGLLGYNGNNLLIKTMDLAYHTPLEFNLGTFTGVRAYLDTLVVSESRVGKSSTADTMRDVYGLGAFVSLAGNSATIAGLVGGSNKTPGGFQTKAGIIPRNHKGLIILEEFGKSKTNIVAELTDIRSSNEVRIARVSGSITLPAMVRMLTLSNVKTLPGNSIRSISSYPHGISVIVELVGSAEDIARYDVMLVLGDKGNTISDPFWEPEEPLPTPVYRTRVRWIWSRRADQIKITEQVGRYLFERANALNEEYDSHIKIFGTEAWKKLARVAIATAGYCVSTDATYENIVVTEEHVDFAYDYFKELYDNKTFKLKEYVEHERSFTNTDEDAATILTEIFQSASGAVLHLEQAHRTSKNMLSAASGLNNDKVNSVINRLLRHKFVRIHGNDIIPTERFRLTLPNINRNEIRSI